jgi:uncharacterized protein (DUF2062 family)
MRKKLSEMSPSELKRSRITSAIGFAAMLIVIQIIIRKGIGLITIVVGGVIAGIVWYLLWYRLTIWIDKRFSKK